MTTQTAWRLLGGGVHLLTMDVSLIPCSPTFPRSFPHHFHSSCVARISRSLIFPALGMSTRSLAPHGFLDGIEWYVCWHTGQLEDAAVVGSERRKESRSASYRRVLCICERGHGVAEPLTHPLSSRRSSEASFYWMPTSAAKET